MNHKKVVIIGGGPANLMAAQYLAEKGFSVDIYEQNKAVARKFLVAGHGGFNLTHSEPIDTFVSKYDHENVSTIVRQFDNTKVITWLNQLGIETYVGSSGKIFPIKQIKPIQVLQAWLNKLNELGVHIHTKHKLLEFDNKTVTLNQLNKNTIHNINFDYLILGLGGGSWAKTGSNGQWTSMFEKKHISCIPFESANSGYEINNYNESLEGGIIKNIAVKYNDVYKKGEITFTHYGIEGSPIYYLNRYTRNTAFPQYIYIDLKPELEFPSILNILSKEKQTTKILKEDLKLNITAINLIKTLSKEDFTSKEKLSQYIKNFPIEITNYRPVDEVISTYGGVSWSELKEDLSLVKYPNVYCNGEMINWEAPTGGYLLQACFSMGHYIANAIL